MATGLNVLLDCNLNILRARKYFKSLIWCQHLLVNINFIHIKKLHLSKVDIRLLDSVSN